MKPVQNRTPIGRWPLSRLVTLMLAGAFAGLTLDVRVEHVDVVREHTIAWLPIVYSAFMTAACSFSVVLWRRPVRLVMLGLYLVALAVGGAGFYFHTHGNVAAVVGTSVKAWTNPRMNRSEGPPQLAPLSFAGLGLLGAVASLNRFAS